METKPNELMDAFHATIDKQLLLHAAGLHIFCPKCNQILDWKTVVILDIFRDGKQIGHQVCCTNCTKELSSINWLALEKKHNTQVEVLSADFKKRISKSEI